MSTIGMGDRNAGPQLLAGFYPSGGLDWRWTARQFSVALLPPPHADQSGAELLVKLYLPESEVQRIGSITMAASIGEIPLPTQTFSKGGAYEYRAEVPAFLIRSNRVMPVLFQLDRALAPWQADGRELGLVVSEIALRSKS